MGLLVPGGQALGQARLGDPPRRPVGQVRRSSGQGRFVGAAEVGLDSPLSLSPALSSFRLEFQNGDHLIREIKLWPGGTASEVNLADRNPDDPYAAYAEWLNVPGSSRETASDTRTSHRWLTRANTGPHGTLHFPGAPIAAAGFTPVISGFRLTTQGSEETDVLRIAAGVTAEGYIDAILQNGGNERPRNVMEHAVQYAIRIAWIPDSMISANGTLTGSSRLRSEASGRLPITSALVALRRFEFSFRNGPHHLQGLGVNLTGRRGPGLSPGEIVPFQDSNRDDPMQWRVDYVELVPGGS